MRAFWAEILEAVTDGSASELRYDVVLDDLRACQAGKAGACTWDSQASGLEAAYDAALNMLFGLRAAMSEPSSSALNVGGLYDIAVGMVFNLRQEMYLRDNQGADA